MSSCRWDPKSTSQRNSLPRHAEVRLEEFVQFFLGQILLFYLKSSLCTEPLAVSSMTRGSGEFANLLWKIGQES
jgi:hypothetical protein